MKPQTSERALQQQVIDLARLTGWRTYHTFDSRRSVSGFPDLVLVNRARRRTLYVELKRQMGQLTEEQAAWLDDLQAAGNECHVWRPADWPLIEQVLTGRSAGSADGLPSPAPERVTPSARSGDNAAREALDERA